MKRKYERRQQKNKKGKRKKEECLIKINIENQCIHYSRIHVFFAHCANKSILCEKNRREKSTQKEEIELKIYDS